MSTSKVIFVDVDGTICTEEKTFDRPLATVFRGAVERINRWHEDGHIIVFWTARGWEQYRITEKWLKDQGFRYHQLLMGKPIADIFIDDRAVKFEGWDREYV